MSNPTQLTFNKDFMTAKDLKYAADTLHHILRAFDDHKDDPEEFALRVLQVRDRWLT
jgi:hypothetical protein